MEQIPDVVRCAAALAWCWLVGAAVVSLICPGLGWLELSATAMLTGLGAVAIELFLFGLLQLPWQPALLAAAMAPLLAAAALLAARRAGGRRVWRPRGTTAEVATAAALGVLLLLATLKAFVVPSGMTQNPDAYGFYLLKARIFFIGQGVVPYLHDQGHLLYTMPDHPPLTPLLVDWLYLVLGGIKEQYAAGVNAVFAAGLTALGYAFARRCGLSRGLALAIAALLAVTQLDWIQMVAYTDGPVGVYLFMAAGYAVLWLRERRTALAVLAGLGLGLAAWTKNEGAAMYYAAAAGLVAALTLGIAGGRLDRRAAWGALALLALPALVSLPWTLAKAEYGVAVVQGNVANLGGIGGLLGRAHERLIPLLSWMAIRGAVRWHAFLLAALVAAGVNLWRWRETFAGGALGAGAGVGIGARLRRAAAVDPGTVFPLIVLALIVPIYVMGMLTSPDPLDSLIHHVTPRLVNGQLTPLFYLVLITQLGAARRDLGAVDGLPAQRQAQAHGTAGGLRAELVPAG